MRCCSQIAPLIWSFLILAGCSRDETLLRDYKLYDLDGSNQSITGNVGGTSVSDVTALAVGDPLIFVEFGGDYQHQGCSYKLIDTSKNSISDLPAGTARRHAAIVAITNQPRGVTKRSCAVRRSYD